MLLNCGVGEDSWESLGLQGDPISPFWRTSALGFLWRESCWSWNSRTLATSCEELTHWKRLWCWEGLRAGGEGDDRGWDGWMASLTRWTWVWMNSGSWWWTVKPGMLHFMGSQRVRHDWATELNCVVGNAKECSNYPTIALISHASKVMLKIIQTRFHHCVKWEIPDVQAGFRKGRGTRDQIANIFWIIEKAREFQKNLLLLHWLH